MTTHRQSPRHPVPTTLVLGSVLIAAVLFASALIRPDTASAGTYLVAECENTAVPDAVYDEYTSTHAYLRTNACPSGPLQIWSGQSGHREGDYGRWSLRAPEGTMIRAVSDLFYAHHAVGNVNGVYAGSAGVLGESNEVLQSWGLAEGTHHLQSATVNARTFWVQLRCYRNYETVCGWSSSTGYPYVFVYDLDLLLEDPNLPRVTGLGGQLSEPGVHRGIDDLTISAADQGSGIARATVRVNGTVIANPTADCSTTQRGYAARFVPCPTNTTLAVSNINTALLPFQEGQNTVEVCVFDYANGGSQPNVSQPCQTFTVQVDNSCPASSGPPASSLSAGIAPKAGQRGDSVTVRSSEPAEISGTLTGASGFVAGGTVCIYERLDLPGNERTLVGVTKTHADGTFEFQVAPGPSRRFDVAYRSNGLQVEHDRSLSLVSVVSPELKITPRSLENGETARFKGEIPGPNAADRVVTLQAKAGKKWRTFKQLSTLSDGRFAGKYRFTRTRGSAVYRFRAVVKRQGGYPYEPGKSPNRKVEVKG